MSVDDTAGVMAEIAAAAKRFLRLFALNDVPAVAACYTEDAQMLVANMQPICGRAGAVESGRYIRRRSDASMFDDGKYLVVWKRVGREWQIYRDMFSTNLPRAAV